MPDLIAVVIDHPLSTLSDGKSDRRAEPAMPQVADLARVMTAEGAIAIDAMPYSII
jgi:hypothetical protein